MSGRGHRLFAAAFAVAAAPWLLQHTDAVDTGVACAATLLAARAPDQLEFGSLIRHRTVTHLLTLWLSILVISYYVLAHEYAMMGAVLFGLGLGGLSHWIGDVGTPKGVPVWHPKRRISLKLWSAQNEMIPIAMTWAIVGLFLGATQLGALQTYWLAPAGGFA